MLWLCCRDFAGNNLSAMIQHSLLHNTIFSIPNRPQKPPFSMLVSRKIPKYPKSACDGAIYGSRPRSTRPDAQMIRGGLGQFATLGSCKMATPPPSLSTYLVFLTFLYICIYLYILTRKKLSSFIVI